jgi:hypothetical protein
MWKVSCGAGEEDKDGRGKGAGEDMFGPPSQPSQFRPSKGLPPRRGFLAYLGCNMTRETLSNDIIWLCSDLTTSHSLQIMS